MKKIFYYFAICIVIGIIISAAFSSVPVYKFVGESFLMNVKKDDYRQAYGMLSSEFQSRNDFDTFKANVIKSGLNTYDKVIWTKEITEADKHHGNLSGVIITRQGTRISLVFEFILDEGRTLSDKGWRIDNIVIKSIEAPKPSPVVQH